MTTAASTRPLPVPDEASAPFFDAAKGGKLLLRFCPACQRYLSYSAEVCDACFSRELEWGESAGKGTVFSFVVVHQVIHPAFANAVPYNVTIVELDEGPRLQTNVIGSPDSDIAIGRRVEVVFEKLSDEVTVPKFRLA